MKLTIKEITIFAMLGAVMYVSKMVMEFLPNVHLLGVFTIAFTVVYRKKALYPIYIFVLLLGMFNGFSAWWIPYLYLWTVLWGATMLLPINMPKTWRPLIYMLINTVHGLLYGTLYAPVQAVMFGLDFEKTVAWIVAGLPWDVMHAISNFVCGLLIVPIISVLRRAEAGMESGRNFKE